MKTCTKEIESQPCKRLLRSVEKSEPPKSLQKAFKKSDAAYSSRGKLASESHVPNRQGRRKTIISYIYVFQTVISFTYTNTDAEIFTAQTPVCPSIRIDSYVICRSPYEILWRVVAGGSNGEQFRRRHPDGPAKIIPKSAAPPPTSLWFRSSCFSCRNADRHNGQQKEADQ